MEAVNKWFKHLISKDLSSIVNRFFFFCILCLSNVFVSHTGLIPLRFFARGSRARAAYNRALENGKTWDSRVRVMLIGESGAGKTSLKRTLKGEKFNNEEPSTQGIEVDPPLVKAGIKPWQDDEENTVFDHKSALLVARQLSVETPTQPSPPNPKSPQSASVEGSEEISHFKPAVDLSSHRAKGNFDGTLISFHPDFTLD